MANWLNVLRHHRSTLVDRVREIGQSKVAKAAGLTEMRVSRFVRSKGADDAKTLYAIAYAVGAAIEMVPELHLPPKAKRKPKRKPKATEA